MQSSLWHRNSRQGSDTNAHLQKLSAVSAEAYGALLSLDLQHMASVNGMPPLQNGMTHAGSQHPASQQSQQQQQQPGMVPVSAVQQDPLGISGMHFGNHFCTILQFIQDKKADTANLGINVRWWVQAIASASTQDLRALPNMRDRAMTVEH